MNVIVVGEHFRPCHQLDVFGVILRSAILDLRKEFLYFLFYPVALSLCAYLKHRQYDYISGMPNDLRYS